MIALRRINQHQRPMSKWRSQVNKDSRSLNHSSPSLSEQLQKSKVEGLKMVSFNMQAPAPYPSCILITLQPVIDGVKMAW